MDVHGEMTLKDVANAGEIARLMLDRAGLDYCCEGDESLDVACVRAEVALSTLQAQLRDLDPAGARDWPHRGIGELLDYIRDVAHPRTKRLLDELATSAEGLPLTPPGRALRSAINALYTHVSRQMSGEETSFFGDVRALAEARKGCGSFPSALLSMHEHGERVRDGHAESHRSLRRLRLLAEPILGPLGDDMRARINAATNALMEQMHLENNELLPRARGLEPTSSSAIV